MRCVLSDSIASFQLGHLVSLPQIGIESFECSGQEALAFPSSENT